jgi:hypothetical protein
MSRVDALLQELQTHHRNGHPGFLAAVRPLAIAIFDDRTPDHARGALLERLAETFERDRRVRDDFAETQSEWRRFIAELKRYLLDL